MTKNYIKIKIIMMKYCYVLLLILLLSNCTVPTATQQPSNKYKSYAKSQFFSEKVNTNDKGNPDGQYQMISEKKITLIQGQYADGVMTGVWMFKDRQGNSYLEVDFSNQKILNSRIKYGEDSTIKNAKAITSSFYSDELGEYILKVFKGFKYPEIAYSNNVEGECIAAIEIDQKGKMLDKQIVRDIGAQCGKTFLKMLDCCDYTWPNLEGKSYFILIPMTFEK